MRKRSLTFMLAACAAAGAACGARAVVVSHADAPAPVPPATAATPAAVEPLSAEDEALNRLPLKLPLVEPKIVVEKGARRLKLYSAGEVVRVRRVALGFEPSGDKQRQGDGRTPEGDFYVCVKNDKSRFYLSLGLSYPNRPAAERGLRDRLITRRQHDRIVRAIDDKRCPPWNTRLGGEIFIHGGGNASDWTWGCVALENADVKELFDSVSAGTPVRIDP
jgi:hypothetical protein